MEVPPGIYSSGNPILIETIVGQLKSQGTFDQFRKECVADVDTKPAYQNLHQRVESAVAKFLEGQTWRSDMNKNQLRDSLRKHIHELGFLEAGVERIVDQVVNPKVHTVFMPQIEDVVYGVQGMPKPEKKLISTVPASTLGSGSKNGGIFNSSVFSQPPPFLPGLSFLPPALQSHMQKPPPTLADLLPTDLDPVSPESSKSSAEGPEKSKEVEIEKEHDESLDSQLSGISDLTSHGSEHGISSKEIKKDMSTFQVVDEDSHLSKVSSNSRLSFTSSDDKSGTKETHSVETEDLEENRLSVDRTFMKVSESPVYEHSKLSNFKTPPRELAEESVIHYEDQFSKEEEVATTIVDPVSDTFAATSQNSEESFHKSPKDDDRINKNYIESTNIPKNHSDTQKEEEAPPNFCQEQEHDHDSTKTKQNLPCVISEADDTSHLHTEESQSSEASENQLHIDEMKDSNSHSEQSIQNLEQNIIKEPCYQEFESTERFGKSPSENIVEASEEARHGFDDSQDALERPPLPLTCPPPLPSDSLSPKSNVSFSCEENGIPRTPRWEPMSPVCDKTSAIATCTPMEVPSSCMQLEDNQAPEREDISQSGSEDMQLAWSPLSVNENKDEEDSRSKCAFENSELASDKNEMLSINEMQSEQQEKGKKESEESIDIRTNLQGDKHHDSDPDKSKSRERPKDERSRERSKNEDRSRKDSSSSLKKYDEKSSSKHKESYERKDSSGKSKHEDKSRSDKERSSHHKSDEKRKGDKERSSSSKHKSSRSEEKHRHRERDPKAHSSSRDDREKEKSLSLREKSGSKSHSSDRDRRDRDKKEREGKDKERRVDKERERSGRDSSKHTEKRRDKEKKEKSSNACRPTHERRSPDPDSNNGSMFGGTQTTGPSSYSSSQEKESNKDENKDASQTDSDSKSSDSSQSKGVCAEAASASPPSSLPLKKRPLHSDSSEVDESCGRLILRIKRVKLEPPYNKQEHKKDHQDKELNQNALLEVEECQTHSPVSPTLYFDNDWPTKSDDEAFCSFVNQLEQSENLSELSDHSLSEINQEVYSCPSDSIVISKSDNPPARLSLSVLSEDQANDFLLSQSSVRNIPKHQKKLKVRQPKRGSQAPQNYRNKSKQFFGERKEGKFKKEPVRGTQDPPGIFKSRRERKPNKRYSNEEFTSSFGYEDDEISEEVCTLSSRSSDLSMPLKSDFQGENKFMGVEDINFVEQVSEKHSLNNNGNKSNLISTSESILSVQASSKAQEQENQRRDSSHILHRREENSNSEDEDDAPGYENELIGTALKSLMMESGLGGPEEASGPNDTSSASHLSQNPTRVQPLSGVKRVGLSRKYKAKANVNHTLSKSFTSKSPTNEEFPLPPSPESDVSASSFEKGRKKAVLGVLVSGAESNSDFGHTAKKADRVKQHYDSDDLYKPRPLLRFTSKRRQVVAEQNGAW